MQYKLLLQNQVAGLTDRTWSISPPSTLGRENDCEMLIDHESISRRHCQFFLNSEEALTIKDLGSLNGTYVDDQRVDHAILMPGQQVQVGALIFQVEILEDAGERKPAVKRPEPSKSPYETQPMEAFTPVQLSDDTPWWKKIFS